MTTRRLFTRANLVVLSTLTTNPARSVQSIIRRITSCAAFTGIVLTGASLANAQSQTPSYPAPPAVCKRTIKADVVALDQAFYNNRVGAFQAGGMIFALRRDVVSTGPAATAGLEPGKVTLRSDKRARPIVLRANVGDCLEISFQNLLSPQPWVGQPPVDSGITQPSTQPGTRYAGVHAMGMQVVSAKKPDSSGNLQPVAPISGDGSWVGANDVFNTANATSGLVAPGGRIVYTIRAAAEGAFLLYSTAANIGASPDFGGQLSQGLFGSVTVQPETAEAYRSQVTHDDLLLATFRSAGLLPNMTLTPKLDRNGQQETIVFEGKVWPLWVLTTRDEDTVSTATVILDDGNGNPVQPPQNGYVKTPDGHPVINYAALYPSSGTDCGKPILKMIDTPRQRDSYGVCAPKAGAAPETYYTDLTAIITGPKAGRFPLWVDSPSFNQNPAAPDRRQPYREFAIHYHDDFTATQAFSQFENSSDPIQYTLRAGRDFFAINYGMGGIGPEVWANRIGVGPMYQCVTCKFEEFFLSSWPNGDPAMIVDVPANSIDPVTKQVVKGPKATKAFYPDDPSNVYHSYIKDHVKFRILHAGMNITHVHHQHAHQWLHTPNSDDSHYRDSQMISPGAAYTLEQVYNGSGNLNQVVGDSIFHCHFYPHFAQGMWALWRTHDVFEEGTELFKKTDYVTKKGGGSVADPSGMAKPGSRALPDGEIAVQLNDGSWAAGTPIPALVPMPTLPMAPLPAKVKIVPATFTTTPVTQSLKIDGTVTGGLAWALNGTSLPNNSSITINPGDTITFGVQSGTHGITFLDKAQAQAVFDFGAGVPFQPQPNIIPNTPNAWGTPGRPAGTTLATLTVKSSTGGVTSVPFICTIHKTAMAGTFQIGAGGVVTVGFKAEVNEADLNAGKNPGFPFFVPGVAGQRVPHPPLDFAREEDEKGNPKLDSNGNPIYLDGGLPRSIAILDVGTYEKHNRWDFSKDNGKLTAFEVPEEGTKVEKVAMAAHAKRAHPSFTPEGFPGSFILNGLPPVSGAPFANPGIDLQGNPVADTRRYKAVNIQLDLVLNKKGWHFPQGRMLTLWGDAQATVENKKPPEPFFFRANSGEVIEYWHSNLVPNYYELDDFQVRTPTDILGQHIHLVKFDVTSSDGAGNGFNYEDGTFSSQEVREQIEHINSAGGLWSFDMKTQTKLTPKSIKELCGGEILMKECVGAQATIQRWYADPQLNNTGYDKTMRTVFTHDHFGPSTHQQAGLYAGLVVEPSGSQWTTQSGDPLGTRSDGGPTTWAANILTKDPADSYREFVLEFQDDQLAYKADSWSTPRPYVKYATPDPPGASWGWADPTHAVAPQTNTGLVITGNQTSVPPAPDPVLVTNAAGTGTYSVNYRNEPLAFRVGAPPNTTATPEQTDLSSVFRSIERADKDLNRQPAQGTQIDPLCSGANCFKFPTPFPGAQTTDPYTPLLRAYEGDKVQVRMLVGAHQSPHAFSLQGLKWLFEPDDPNSGYRSTQGTGISEHYEMLFNLPRTGAQYQTDYQYATSSDTTGLQNGNWGLLRAYSTAQSGLNLLPNNAYVVSGPLTTTCAPYAPKQRYDVTVTTAAKALGGPLVYNSRGAVGTPGQKQLAATSALMYVRSDDLDSNGKLKAGVPVEPLILRAAAGDCIEVNLTNALPTEAAQKTLNTGQTNSAPFTYPLFGFTASQNDISQMVFFFSQPNAQYSTKFRDRFNQNTFGYKLPASPTDPSVATSVIMPGAVWQITLASSDPGSPPTIFVVSKTSLTRMDIAIGIQLNTSREVGLHPQLVSYDMNKANGVNVGLNPVVTVKPGESKTVTWYAGTIERDGAGVRHTPVEFGSVNLTPSDPLRQHPYGMIGALIVEPEGSKWQTDVNSRASAVVTKADRQQFREFVSLLQDDVTGISFWTPPSGNGSSITISGDIFNGSPTWIMNGQPLPSSGVKLSPGQTVTFDIKTGTHGLLFNNETSARKVFDIAGSPDASKFKVLPNQCSIATPFGTSPQPSGTIATIKVKQAVTLTSLPFICSQHCQNMPGSFAISTGGGGKTVAISGDVLNGHPTWVMNGKALPASGVTLNAGDTVTFDIKAGKHGLLFDDEASARAVFDISGSPDASKFKVLPNQCSIASAFGTEPQLGGHIATITVNKQVTLTSLPFLCSQHCQAMTGLFTLGSTSPVTGGPPLAVNYRSEWVNYRYSGQNLPFGVSPLGIARALSNTIVSADPQTPIFAASAGMPVRFRNLHPGGINEQIWTLHGHEWQEEPYVNGSTQIGDNRLSQHFGSRDAFVANSSFDAVIDKAGGAAGTTGDYLYRTFVQVDFQDGIWGILRVGEPGKDIVTITTFAPQTSGGAATLMGTNTVNPSTGQMADSVAVTNAASGATIGTFPVDKMTGAWPAGGATITIPASVTAVRVTSSLGGVAVAPTYTQQVGVPAAPSSPAPPDDEVFKFRQRPNAKPGGPKK